MVIIVFSTEKAMGIAAYMKKKLKNVDLVGDNNNDDNNNDDNDNGKKNS